MLAQRGGSSLELESAGLALPGRCLGSDLARTATAAAPPNGGAQKGGWCDVDIAERDGPFSPSGSE